MQSIELALKDAERAIEIDPEWPKVGSNSSQQLSPTPTAVRQGYFRKGQALKALNRNSDALVSLKEVSCSSIEERLLLGYFLTFDAQGQRLQPENAEFVTLIEEIQKLKLQDRMEEKEDENADQVRYCMKIFLYILLSPRLLSLVPRPGQVPSPGIMAVEGWRKVSSHLHEAVQ